MFFGGLGVPGATAAVIAIPTMLRKSPSQKKLSLRCFFVAIAEQIIPQTTLTTATAIHRVPDESTARFPFLIPQRLP